MDCVPAPPCLLQVVHGTVYVPVVNVGTTEAVLYPWTGLGTLSTAQVVSLPAGVTEMKPILATTLSQAAAASVPSRIECLDLCSLTEQKQEDVKHLLRKYESVFSTHDGDLGCTNLIAHDIPLLDDVPVRQRYRRIPPSEYEAVKVHINQLLESQVIRESNLHISHRPGREEGRDIARVCRLLPP